MGAAEPDVGVPMGSRWGLKDLYVSTRVFRTERSARVDESDLASLGGPDAELLRRQGFLYQVGSPIVVEGHLWGAMTMNSKEALPPDTSERLEKFTELVATAIANAESREALERARRRAGGAAPRGDAGCGRRPAGGGFRRRGRRDGGPARSRPGCAEPFEPGDEIFVLAHRGLDVDRTPVGSHVSIEGESATAEVRRTGRPARMDDYESAEGALAELARTTGLRSSVSAPITVEGGLWGLITASWKGERSPPPDTEERMAKFAALWIRRSPTPRRARRSSASPTSRRRCGAWRRWSRTSRRPPRCSRRSPRRWGGCWASRTRRSSAMRTTGPPPWSLTAASVTFPCRSAAECRWRERARPRWCVARGARPGSTTSRVPPGRSRITRATRASARPSAARSWSTVGSGAP